MKYFHSGFLFASGCIVALLLTWLVTQFFVRLKLQEINYRGKPRVMEIQLDTGRGRTEELLFLRVSVCLMPIAGSS